MIEFSDSQARLIRDCVTEVVLNRQRRCEPIPDRVRALLAYVSAGGRAPEGQRAQLNREHDDLIDTDQAAAILGVTTRHVRRLTADLNGQQVSGTWVFRRSTVTEYAEHRRAA